MFRKIFLLFIALIAALIACSYLLPREAVVARSTVINAPPDVVFPLLDNYRKFNEWSPWAKRDPNAEYTFSGPEQGVGAKMTWSSDNPDVGSGSQEIIASTPNSSLKVSLDFGAMGVAEASFELVPEGAGTRVTWGFESDLGMNPLSRYMGLMMDSWIGPDYEQGLANLKVLAEQQAAGN